jgi:hypothetical protein
MQDNVGIEYGDSSVQKHDRMMVEIGKRGKMKLSNG